MTTAPKYLTAQIATRVEPHLRQGLEEVAEEQGRNLSDIFRDALTAYVLPRMAEQDAEALLRSTPAPEMASRIRLMLAELEKGKATEASLRKVLSRLDEAAREAVAEVRKDRRLAALRRDQASLIE